MKFNKLLINISRNNKQYFSTSKLNLQVNDKITINEGSSGFIGTTIPSSPSSSSAPSSSIWADTINNAEQLVGFPTTFLSIHWLMNDDLSNMKDHFENIINNSNPLLKLAQKAAKQIIFIVKNTEDKKNNLHNRENQLLLWGLTTMMMSKAAQCSPFIADGRREKKTGILHDQRTLAEIIEIMRTAHLIHQGMVNLQPWIGIGAEMKPFNKILSSNKYSLLGGDYLLAKSTAKLASLRNNDVLEIIYSGLRDLTESEFIGDRDKQNNPLPSKPKSKLMINRLEKKQKRSNDEDDIYIMDALKPLDKQILTMGEPEREWTLRNKLDCGNLLARACEGALKLGGHSDIMQKYGYFFGKHFALAWHASLDLKIFQHKTLPNGKHFNLTAAPILFHLDYNPKLYDDIKIGTQSIEDINFGKIYREVRNGPGMDRTKKLQEKHIQLATHFLNKFPVNDALNTLQNIIVAMKHY